MTESSKLISALDSSFSRVTFTSMKAKALSCLIRFSGLLAVVEKIFKSQ